MIVTKMRTRFSYFPVKGIKNEFIALHSDDYAAISLLKGSKINWTLPSTAVADVYFPVKGIKTICVSGYVSDGRLFPS